MCKIAHHAAEVESRRTFKDGHMLPLSRMLTSHDAQKGTISGDFDGMNGREATGLFQQGFAKHGTTLKS